MPISSKVLMVFSVSILHLKSTSIKVMGAGNLTFGFRSVGSIGTGSSVIFLRCFLFSSGSSIASVVYSNRN